MLLEHSCLSQQLYIADVDAQKSEDSGKWIMEDKRMFGFYKNEKDNTDGVFSKHTDEAVEAVDALETATDTAGMQGTHDTADTHADTKSESFGFLGRFATDEDYQRQVVKRYVCFPETRDYLNQIKNCRQRIELLEKRQSYRSTVNMDIIDIGIEITEEEQKLARLRAEVSDEISKLDNVRQEMVMNSRYVDGMSWEKIAADMGSTIRSVQSIHGRALPAMEEVLVADGKIELSEDSGDRECSYYGHRGYHGYSGHLRYHYGSQKYHQPYQYTHHQHTHQHPESHSSHSTYGDLGYEETADDKCRESYGEYEDYEFFSD